MGCNSCRRNPCACNVVPLPYYEDPCFQESQCQGAQIFNQYSPVLRIATEWAVPLGDNILTLRVVALADMLIGSIIWNPQYGSYLVTSYNFDAESIKVVKTEFNNVEVGTPIPACSKFLVSVPFDNIINPAYVDYDAEWEAGTGGGSIDIVTESNQYTTTGESIFISLNNEIEITGSLDYLEFEIPFLPFGNSNLGQRVPCNVTLVGTGNFDGYIEFSSGTKKVKVYKTSGTFAAGNWIINNNFFYRRAT